MNLTHFAIKNDHTVLVLVLSLFVAGILSFLNLPKQQDPGFTIRAAVVSTRFPGASHKQRQH